jgi:hypothetical protein
MGFAVRRPEEKMKTHLIQKRVHEATDQLIAALEAGQSQALKDYLTAMGRFHRYSVGNTLLIWFQRPTATHVAGFYTWQQLGRRVRKGERGIAILAPIVRRLKEKDEDDELERTVVAFRSAYVFDVAQTDGRPLAEFATVKGDPGTYQDRLHEFLGAHGIVVAFSRLPGSVQGMSTGGKIVIREGLAPAEQFSTTVHETAHELLKHHAEAGEIPKTVRETEAEAVAFVVSQAIGLDYNTAACDYIKLYDGRKETLQASLERVRRVAGEIIGALLDADNAAAAGPVVAHGPTAAASAA